MQLFNNKNLFTVLTLVAAAFLSGCSTTSEDKTLTYISLQSDTQISHKIAIVNASENVINTVKYKPCGSRPESYQYLTGNLRPTEKFTINIYSQCVDLLATNAFKKKLVDAQNVNLTTTNIWTIK